MSWLMDGWMRELVHWWECKQSQQQCGKLPFISRKEMPSPRGHSGCRTRAGVLQALSHRCPPIWCQHGGTRAGEVALGALAPGAGSQTLVRAPARPELAHRVCCVLFPLPPTSGTGPVLWWDGSISKVEFVCEGVGSMLMSVGHISCVSARQWNAGSPQHVLVANKSVSPKIQRCCVCTVGCVQHTNTLRSCSPWRAFLVIVGMCALKIRVKRSYSGSWVAFMLVFSVVFNFLDTAWAEISLLSSLFPFQPFNSLGCFV